MLKALEWFKSSITTSLLQFVMPTENARVSEYKIHQERTRLSRFTAAFVEDVMTAILKIRGQVAM